MCNKSGQRSVNMEQYQRKRSRQSVARIAAVRCLIWFFAMEEARGFLTLPCHRIDSSRTAICARLRLQSSPPLPAAADVASCSYQHPPTVETPLKSLREEVGVPGQEFPLRGKNGKGPFGEDGDDEEDDFSMNVGRALDYLAHDVPLMFSAPPRLDIFTPSIVLKVRWYGGMVGLRVWYDSVVFWSGRCPRAGRASAG